MIYLSPALRLRIDENCTVVERLVEPKKNKYAEPTWGLVSYYPSPALAAKMVVRDHPELIVGEVEAETLEQFAMRYERAVQLVVSAVEGKMPVTRKKLAG